MQVCRFFWGGTGGSTQECTELDRSVLKKELSTLQARDKELDGLFERIYEDNVSSERVSNMSRRYEDEQKEISVKMKALESELNKLGSKAMTSDTFLSIVRKYTRAKKLTPRMLNERIEKIEVPQAEKIDGVCS